MTLWESCIFFFRAHKYIYFIIKGNFVEILWFAHVPGLGALRRFSGLGGGGLGEKCWQEVALQGESANRTASCTADFKLRATDSSC